MLRFALALIGGILAVLVSHRRGRNAIRKTSALITLSVLVITPLITGLATTLTNCNENNSRLFRGTPMLAYSQPAARLNS